jgi:C-terminal processing protease CtpA/Prc
MRAKVPSVILLTISLGLTLFALARAAGQAQPAQRKSSSFDPGLVSDMLQAISSDVKKHYYDPRFHGIDWDSNVRAAEQRINASSSLNQALSEVAAALDALNDSHTFFLPPQHAYKHDFGWQIEMVGDHCFVTQIRPKSDGESKGIKRGDEVQRINGYQPARANLWKMNYVFNILRPQPGLHVELRTPRNEVKQVDLMAAMQETKRVKDLTARGGGGDIWDLIRESENAESNSRARSVELGDEIEVLKFPGFSFSQTEVEDMIKKARKHKAMILDLRGNSGGSVDTLKWLLGGMFDKEVKIGDRVTRDGSKPMMAKSSKNNVFGGQLIVLVGSRSASASELFARVVQLEKRGIVLGDKTAGAVMEARRYSYEHGVDTVIFYGASITDADIIMTDGKSLEHVGVIPDQLLLPTADDLANNRDPVLAHAVEMCGAKITPEAAGALVPFEWPPQ